MAPSRKSSELTLELNAVDNTKETTEKAEKRISKYQKACEKVMRLGSGAVDTIGHRFTDFSVAVSNVILLLQDQLVNPLKSMISSFSQVGFSMEKMASSAHLSVEQLGALGFAAEQTGSSTNAVSSAMENMESKMTEASRGSLSAMQEIYQGCGKTFAEMRNLSPEERFMAVADVIQSVGDEAAKADIARKMFGSDELLPLLKQGRAGIQALMQEGRDLDGPFSPENVAKSKQLFQAINRIKTLIESIKTSFLTNMADTITDFLSRVNDALKSVLKYVNEHPRFVKAIALITAGIVSFITAGSILVPLLMGVNTLFSGFVGLAGAFLSPWVLIPTLIGGSVAAFLSLNGSLSKVLDFFKQTFSNIINTLRSFFGDAIGFIMQGNFSEAWRSLWLRILILYYEFKNKISDELHLFGEIWEGVVDTFKPLADAFAQLWNWIVGAFSSSKKQACDYLYSLFLYWNDTFSKMWKACTTWFSSILDSVGASSSSIAEVFMAGWFAAEKAVLKVFYAIKDAFIVMISFLKTKWNSWGKSVQHGVNYITGKMSGLSDDDIQKMNQETDKEYDKKAEDIQWERNEALLQSEAESKLAIENTRKNIAERVKSGREKQEKSKSDNQHKIELAQQEIAEQKLVLAQDITLSNPSENPDDPNYQSGGKPAPFLNKQLQDAAHGTQNSFQAMFGFGQTTDQKQLEVSRQILSLFQILMGNAGL